MPALTSPCCDTVCRALPVWRPVQRQALTPLSEMLLEGEMAGGDSVRVEVGGEDDGWLVLVRMPGGGNGDIGRSEEVEGARRRWRGW